jgi:hypothetical protein
MSIRLTKVDELPGRRTRNRSKDVFSEFMKSQAQIVMISYDEGEYVKPESLYHMLQKAAKRENHPIQVSMRQSTVYLIRTDM